MGRGAFSVFKCTPVFIVRPYDRHPSFSERFTAPLLDRVLYYFFCHLESRPRGHDFSEAALTIQNRNANRAGKNAPSSTLKSGINNSQQHHRHNAGLTDDNRLGFITFLNACRIFTWRLNRHVPLFCRIKGGKWSRRRTLSAISSR